MRKTGRTRRDEEDNITDGPLIGTGSEVNLCICMYVRLNSINNASCTVMFITSDLEKGHS